MIPVRRALRLQHFSITLSVNVGKNFVQIFCSVDTALCCIGGERGVHVCRRLLIRTDFCFFDHCGKGWDQNRCKNGYDRNDDDQFHNGKSLTLFFLHTFSPCTICSELFL